MAYVVSGKQWDETDAWAYVDITAPDGSTNYGSYSCIAWHPTLDRPAVAFYDADHGSLWYVFIGDPVAPQAAVEVVEGANAVGLYPSLTFNPDTGEPGIAYHDATGADLCYVERSPL